MVTLLSDEVTSVEKNGGFQKFLQKIRLNCDYVVSINKTVSLYELTIKVLSSQSVCRKERLMLFVDVSVLFVTKLF